MRTNYQRRLNFALFTRFTEQPSSEVAQLLDGVSRQRQLPHVPAPAQPKPLRPVRLVAGPQGLALLQQEVAAAGPPDGRQRGDGCPPGLRF